MELKKEEFEEIGELEFMAFRVLNKEDQLIDDVLFKDKEGRLYIVRSEDSSTPLIIKKWISTVDVETEKVRDKPIHVTEDMVFKKKE